MLTATSRERLSGWTSIVQRYECGWHGPRDLPAGHCKHERSAQAVGPRGVVWPMMANNSWCWAGVSPAAWGPQPVSSVSPPITAPSAYVAPARTSRRRWPVSVTLHRSSRPQSGDAQARADEWHQGLRLQWCAQLGDRPLNQPQARGWRRWSSSIPPLRTPPQAAGLTPRPGPGV